MLGIKYLFALIGLMAAIAFLVVFTSNAAQPGTKKLDYPKAYEVFNQKCTGCHASVADPEKPGRTRDDWHLVVNVMHGHLPRKSTDQILFPPADVLRITMLRSDEAVPDLCNMPIRKVPPA